LSARRAWRRFEVSLTGPFLTGQPLQVRIPDYSRLQRDLGEELRRTSEGWDYEGIRWRGVDSYGSGGGYTSLVPLVLIRREGDPLKRRLEELQRDRPAGERQWLEESIAGWKWELRTLRIELYDLGVGVITGTYDVTAPALLSAEATRRTGESVGRLLRDAADGSRSPVAASYEALARETVGLFAGAVAACAGEARREPWLNSFLTALPPEPIGRGPTSPEPADGEWGRLLWLHSLFLLTSGPGVSSRRLHRISRPFEVAFSRTVDHWHGVFAPGIDSSVLVLHENNPKQKGPPMRLSELMSAYYALFMEMDRGLLAVLDDDKWQKGTSLGELEEDADRIFGVYMRVQEARARLDSALTDLAGGQLSIWNTISEVQKFDELVAGVERKVATLQRIAERRVQEASAARARRTRNILSGLTALTVVTLMVTVLESLVGTRTDAGGHIEVRIGIVVAALGMATLIYRKASAGRVWRDPAPELADLDQLSRHAADPQ
jgi:hypothetical protein